MMEQKESSKKDEKKEASKAPQEASAEPNGEAQKNNDPVSELKILSERLKEEEQKFLYLYAEFENYKKRVFKERSDLMKFGSEPLLRELLTVFDNMDRALEHCENAETGVLEGIKMVQIQLQYTLEKFGITPVPTKGEKFDPQIHEAVGHVQADNDVPEGHILKEEQKGFSLHGRLLRPAKVLVSKTNEGEKKVKQEEELGEKNNG